LAQPKALGRDDFQANENDRMLCFQSLLIRFSDLLGCDADTFSKSAGKEYFLAAQKIAGSVESENLFLLAGLDP